MKDIPVIKSVEINKEASTDKIHMGLAESPKFVGICINASGTPIGKPIHYDQVALGVTNGVTNISYRLPTNEEKNNFIQRSVQKYSSDSLEFNVDNKFIKNSELEIKKQIHFLNSSVSEEIARSFETISNVNMENGHVSYYRSHMENLCEQLKNDSDYAWAFQANIATPIMDELDVTHEQANLCAARIMKLLFGVDVTTQKEWEHFKILWLKNANSKVTSINNSLSNGDCKVFADESIAENKLGSHKPVVHNDLSPSLFSDNKPVTSVESGLGVGLQELVKKHLKRNDAL